MFAFSASLPGRQLKSADGSQVMEAEFVRYMVSRNMVTLKVNGRDIVVPASKFSEEDRKFFVDAQQEIDKKEAIKVNIKANNDYSKEAQGQLMVSYRTSKYTFEVTNTSESYLDGLVLRYWVVVEQGKKGEEVIDIKTDSKGLMPLAAGASEIVEGPELKLASGARTMGCPTCPKVRRSLAYQASLIVRDRVIGTKVEVVDAKGQVIYSDISSNRTKSLLDDKEGK